MACCEFLDPCFFYNKLATDMPLATDYLRDTYCNGHFTECVIFRISKVYGNDKVPHYLYPNDMDAILDINHFEPDDSLDTFHRVIYTDGKAGMEKAATIGGLRRAGKLVAFEWSGVWVEVRRKNKSPYSGVDRRKTKPVTVFDRFNSDEKQRKSS
jgi:hypothetical protein